MKKVYKNLWIFLLFLGIVLITACFGSFFKGNDFLTYVFLAGALFYFAAFFYVNRGLVKLKNIFLRYLLLGLLDGVVTFIVGFIVLVAGVNLHLTMGGHF